MRKEKRLDQSKQSYISKVKIMTAMQKEQNNVLSNLKVKRNF
jgi:hypothetical protein